MKKFFAILLLVSATAYSQDFTIIQIDSIAQKYGTYYNTDGVISVKENNEIIASGGSSTSYSLYLPYLDTWKKLPPAEKKTTDYKKGSQLIKGHYHKVLHYEKEGYSIETTVELYYKNEQLFAAKVSERKYTQDSQLAYGITLHPVKNGTFDGKIKPETKELIEDTNGQILENYHEE